MKKVFEECTLGNMILKNRLVRSATLENGGADNGFITPLLKEVYEELAEGEVGLIITGMMGVGPNACVNSSMVKIYDNSFIDKFSEVTHAVHQLGGKIVVQLGHCGAKANVIDWGDRPFCPSEHGKSKEITKDEMKTLLKKYGEAALKCKMADADGVQIHAAHGYLISEFLSPYFNKRVDEYGGDIQNRAKYLFDIYDEIRSSVGEGYPVLIKINYNDLVEDGLTGEECAWVCMELEKRGIDAIEISSGIGVSTESAPTQPSQKKIEGFFADGALDISHKVTTPVISVGGYRSLAVIEEKLNQGNISAISLCRPFIREPLLLKKWKNGNKERALCVSCNGCFSRPQHGCILNK